MPFKRYTVFNPQGEPDELTDIDRLNEARAAQMSDYAFRGALANNELQDRERDRQNRLQMYGTFADKAGLARDMEGNFADRQSAAAQDFARRAQLAKEMEGDFATRSAQQQAMQQARYAHEMGITDRTERGSTERAGLQYGASNSDAALRRAAWDEGAKERQGYSQIDEMLRNRLMNKLNSGADAYNQTFDEAGTGVVPGTPDQEDAKSFDDIFGKLMMMRGKAPYVSPDQVERNKQIGDLQLEDMRAGIEQKKFEPAMARVDALVRAGRVDEAKAVAAKFGVPFSPPEVEDIKSIGAALDADLDAFGKKDNSTFGWNPTDEDVTNLEQQATKYRDTLIKKYGMSPQDAQTNMAQRVMRALTPHRGMATGYIDELLRRLGISKRGEPAQMKMPSNMSLGGMGY